MAKIPESYLTHRLIPLEKYGVIGDCVCKICGVELYYESFQNLNEFYFTKNKIGEHSINCETEGICSINCEEYIIKNIIE